MRALVDLGTVTEATRSSCLQGRFRDGPKVFVPSLNMWICLTSDCDPTQPPMRCPVG